MAIGLVEDEKDVTRDAVSNPAPVSENDASQPRSSEDEDSSSDDCGKVRCYPNCGIDDWGEWNGRCKNGGHRCCIRCLGVKYGKADIFETESKAQVFSKTHFHMDAKRAGSLVGGSKMKSRKLLVF